MAFKMKGWSPFNQNEDNLIKAFSLQTGHGHIVEEDMLKAPEDVVSLIPEDFAVANNVLLLSITSLFLDKFIASSRDFTF